MKLGFMQTTNGNFRVRAYENENENDKGSFLWECQFTTAQWKAILDIVGVAASVAAGSADTISYSPAVIPAGKLAQVDFD